MTARTLSLAFVCASLLLCAASPIQDAAPQDWPPLYRFIHDGDYGDMPSKLAALPFSRIELERTTCFGACPAYTVTFHRDGQAEYVGREWAPREGTFSGEIGPFSYGRLCLLIERSGFEKMKSKYFREETDHANAYVRVWLTDSAEPIVVRDYGDYGPIELWSLQEAIDSVASGVRWTRVLTNDEAPEHRKPHGIEPDEGFVPDAQTAIQIALAVWRPIYGQTAIPARVACSATLGKEGNWSVEGPLTGDVGGVVVAEIAKDSGMVVRVKHHD